MEVEGAGDSQMLWFKNKQSVTGVRMMYQFTMQRKQGVTTKAAVEHQFTLADNDVGDQLQVDVYEDPIYGTGVFKLVGGMTKCPHENGTLAREALKPTLTQDSFPDVPVGGTQPVRVDVINMSETDEDVTLSVSARGALHTHTHTPACLTWRSCTAHTKAPLLCLRLMPGAPLLPG